MQSSNSMAIKHFKYGKGPSAYMAQLLNVWSFLADISLVMDEENFIVDNEFALKN